MTMLTVGAMIYSGNGRFPDGCYIMGGLLKDVWSYLMPGDGCLDLEVSMAFSVKVTPHVNEQTEVLRSLYLSTKTSKQIKNKDNTSTMIEKKNLDTIIYYVP